jgi:hypothetical protein
LQKHQSKFCVGSNYEDVHKIDNRFNQLQTEKNMPIPTTSDIKQYVGDYKPVPMGYNDILGEDRFNHASTDAKRHRQDL